MKSDAKNFIKVDKHRCFIFSMHNEITNTQKIMDKSECLTMKRNRENRKFI